ncbi:uncharacterized protein LOC130905211 [Corythoichthys intestinalis]|uniref:uncharacterized protein LOC130905211 n=1 Tax=Corythoichthys intestinalis TaxID=161448 RepID=UPI0025A5B63B|nr:uncharacterized protein LOC130905211 [Corythoichthys intestinalis]
MENLEGGWLFYKAAGGHGRRKLSAVAFESEGYTGTVLRSASASGKFMLYIAPLQEEIDMTPLPADAPEFSLMPKATCTQCKKILPLQMLALHVQGDCGGTSGTTDSEEDDYPESSVPVTADVENNSECPICSKQFPGEEIEFHASTCGASPVWGHDAGPHDLQGHTQTTTDYIACVQSPDVGLEMCNVLKQPTQDEITEISWENILERGLNLWQCQKTARPANILKVTFIGEAGVDTGALRKEFLSEMVAGIETRLFEGGEKGKIPKYSISDLDKSYYKTAGEIFAVSLGQGGPPPRFFQDWCYQYLVTASLKDITKDNVHDEESSSLIQKVC